MLSLHHPIETMNIQKWQWFVQFPQRLLLGLLLQGPQNLNEQRWFNIFSESSFVKWFSIDKGLFMLNEREGLLGLQSYYFVLEKNESKQTFSEASFESS